MDKKIKITHVARFAKPRKGGIEAFIEMFNKCIDKNIYDISVLCNSNSDKSSFDENGVFFNRAGYFFEFASNTFSFDFLLKLSKVNTDIIIYHMPFIFAVLCHFTAKPKYKKMIVCYHSDIVGYDNIMKPFWKMYKNFLDTADIIHVQSPQMLESPFIGEFKNKTAVIPYLTDTNIKCNIQNVNKIKEEYHNKKIIFALGRLVKYKGFEYLIEAVKNVENAVLLLGGTGPLGKDFKTYINKNNLDAKVKLLGRVDDLVLQDYYEACDIFVLPSSMPSETFAVVQLEAMKYSKPVINTNLNTGVNYVSVDGETGLTVEARNPAQLAGAINKLINDDNMRLQYGKNARKRAENLFDLKKMKSMYQGIIGAVLESR